MRLTVIGADIVAAGFAEAAATVNERLVEAGKPVADSIAETQRELFAQQFTSRSGATYDSISAELSERDDAIYEVGPETFYARFANDGTARQPPRPFVEPAGDLHADDWFAAAQDVAADI